MRILRFAMFVILLISSFACSNRDVVRSELSKPQYETLALEKYGSGFESAFNSSRTAVLCFRRSKPTLLYPQQQVSFFVYDVKAGSVVFEDDIPNGSVGWNDESSVLVTVVPGTVKAEDQPSQPRPGYIYDLLLKKTRNVDSVIVR